MAGRRAAERRHVAWLNQGPRSPSAGVLGAALVMELVCGTVGDADAFFSDHAEGT